MARKNRGGVWGFSVGTHFHFGVTFHGKLTRSTWMLSHNMWTVYTIRGGFAAIRWHNVSRFLENNTIFSLQVVVSSPRPPS